MELTKPTIGHAIVELRGLATGPSQPVIDQAKAVVQEIGETATDVGQSVAERAGDISREARTRVASTARGAIRRRRKDPS